MGLKDLHASLDSMQEDELREIAARGNNDTYRGLSQGAREQLFAFLKKTGISETKVVLLGMLLGDKRPDLLTIRKLAEITDEIRAQVISATMNAEQGKRMHPEKRTGTKENPHRLLSPREIMARFRKLGVDIQQLFWEWEGFYNRGNYGTAVRKNMAKDAFSLVMPAITNQAMEAFEKNFGDKRIDSFMLDDARVGDGTTLRAFERKTLKRFKTMHNFGSVHAAEQYINRSTLTPPIVRMVGYSTAEMIIDPQNLSKSRRKFHEQEPYVSTMGLGTYLRLFHYLNAVNPLTLLSLRTYTDRTSGLLRERTIALNNRTEENGTLSITHDQRDPQKPHLIEVNPAIASTQNPLESPIVVVSSDNFGMLRNTNDRRALAHMDTWPAPANSEEEAADDDEEDIPF